MSEVENVKLPSTWLHTVYPEDGVKEKAEAFKSILGLTSDLHDLVSASFLHEIYPDVDFDQVGGLALVTGYGKMVFITVPRLMAEDFGRDMIAIHNGGAEEIYKFMMSIGDRNNSPLWPSGEAFDRLNESFRAYMMDDGTGFGAAFSRALPNSLLLCRFNPPSEEHEDKSHTIERVVMSVIGWVEVCRCTGHDPLDIYRVFEGVKEDQ